MNTTDPETSDKTLLARLKRGRDDAATAFYMRYAERLRKLAANQMQNHLASRVDPEDIVQSVFRTFFRRAELGQYDLPEGEQLWRLLLVISLNKVRSQAEHHRAAKRDVAVTHSMSGDESIQNSERGNETDLAVLNMTIEEVLADYTDAQKQVIYLRIAEHDIDEIVRQTNRSKRTIERTLQRFRQMLADKLNIAH